MSKNLEKTYNPKEIEPKLYEKWCENKYFHAEVDRSKKPFTIVMPPPNKMCIRDRNSTISISVQ